MSCHKFDEVDGYKLFIGFFVLTVCGSDGKDNIMKFKKASVEKRRVYVYDYTNEEGKLVHITLEEGKDDVTAEHIKLLHALDDAEVYNNIKNSKPSIQEWEKPAIKEWKLNHPNDELPKRWNISINEMVGSDENVEREEFISASTVEDEESDVMRSLHELYETFSELQKEVYNKVFLQGMSYSAVARERGKSEASVRKAANRIKEIIASDEKIKNFFV